MLTKSFNLRVLSMLGGMAWSAWRIPQRAPRRRKRGRQFSGARVRCHRGTGLCFRPGRAGDAHALAERTPRACLRGVRGVGGRRKLRFRSRPGHCGQEGRVLGNARFGQILRPAARSGKEARTALSKLPVQGLEGPLQNDGLAPNPLLVTYSTPGTGNGAGGFCVWPMCVPLGVPCSGLASPVDCRPGHGRPCDFRARSVGGTTGNLPCAPRACKCAAPTARTEVEMPSENEQPWQVSSELRRPLAITPQRLPQGGCVNQSEPTDV